MRSEVQEILDKEWPDRKVRDRIRYGDIDKFHALCALARYAEDIGDEELAIEADKACRTIEDPTPTKTRQSFYYDLVGYSNYEHNAIHAKHGAQVFIFREKHGDWMYDASTMENASRAVLSVLERRLEDGWLMDTLPEEKAVPDQMDIFKSNKVPATEADEARAIIELARSGKAGCLPMAGKKAYRFLMARSGYEYEEFKVERLSTPEFKLKTDFPF